MTRTALDCVRSVVGVCTMVRVRSLVGVYTIVCVKLDGL